MTVDGSEKPLRDRVFMDITIGGLPSGRIVFELFNDIAPKTAENFRALCAGDMGLGKITGKPLTYKGMVFHRVVKDFMIQGGDFTNANGTGGESIYGGTFEDETFEVQHDKPYLLSMANRGKDTNGSQFFITTQPAPHLDNVHCVFGNVVSGAALVRQLEALPVDRNARPLQDVVVANCGQLVKLDHGKRRKKDKQQEKESGEESDQSHKKEKKKKKDKKKKRSRSKSAEDKPQQPSHPLVSTSNIDPREIPEVPTNRFLMRGGPDQHKDKFNMRRDRERMRLRERERHGYTRSGRSIKGRGVFRYRTPSRSRSRSRSATPPHWKQAQRRIVKLAHIEQMEREQIEQEPRGRPAEHSREDEEGTPERPCEKEEGELDSTLEHSRHEKVDYNALDFEEEVEHDEREPTQKRLSQAVVPRTATNDRADMLARAFGVSTKHERDIRESMLKRRENLASSAHVAPKLSSAIATVSHEEPKVGQKEENKGYDPFSLLRSQFSKNKQDNSGSEQRPGRFERERPKKDRSSRDKYRNERDTRYFDDRFKNDQNQQKEEVKYPKKDNIEVGERERRDKRDRREVSKDKHDKDLSGDRKISEKDKSMDRDDKKISEKDVSRDRDDRKADKDRSRDKNDRREKYVRDRSKDDETKEKSDRDKDRKERYESDRSKEKSRDVDDRRRSKDRSEKRDNRRGRSRDRDSKRDRDDDRKKEDKASSSGRPRSKSRSRDRKQSDRKTPDKMGEDEKKKEEEKDKARKELMEIVRMIKSRQRERENKATEAKKKRHSSESDDSDGRSKRRRSSDRGRRSRSRGRHRRSRSPRSRRNRRSSSSN